MITFINGLQWQDYKKYEFSCVLEDRGDIGAQKHLTFTDADDEG